MVLSRNDLGEQLFGLYRLAQVGLLGKPWVVLSADDDCSLLLQAAFSRGSQVTVRFPDGFVVEVPLGRVEAVLREHRGSFAFVHESVVPFASGQVFVAKGHLLIEVRPGPFADSEIAPDVICIDRNLRVLRFSRPRQAGSSLAAPFSFEFLLALARKVFAARARLVSLLGKEAFVACDIVIEEPEKVCFVGLRPSGGRVFDNDELSVIGDYFVVRSLDDIEQYDGKKPLFFDMPLSSDAGEIARVIQELRLYPEVFVRSLSMHMALLLREAGVRVRRAHIKEMYEVDEAPLSSLQPE